jgi:hypothetical protein
MGVGLLPETVMTKSSPKPCIDNYTSTTKKCQVEHPIGLLVHRQ